jgi:hypothetical protein
MRGADFVRLWVLALVVVVLFIEAAETGRSIITIVETASLKVAYVWWMFVAGRERS